VWAILLGGAGTLAHVPGSDLLIEAGALWILLGQVNLYRRVNELCSESLGQECVYAWWALLCVYNASPTHASAQTTCSLEARECEPRLGRPPPFDVIVGLRQVHFLAKHWATVRGEEWQPDPVAEEWFPFISAERFTLRGLVRTPSIWFGFTKRAPDLDLPPLPRWLPGGE